MKSRLVIGALLGLAACATGGVADVDPIYSDVTRGAAGGGGFPELARDLGAISQPDCVMERDTWEAAFVARNITSSRRVSNALNGMNNNGQAIYFPDRGVLAIAAEFCKP